MCCRHTHKCLLIDVRIRALLFSSGSNAVSSATCISFSLMCAKHGV